MPYLLKTTWICSPVPSCITQFELPSIIPRSVGWRTDYKMIQASLTLTLEACVRPLVECIRRRLSYQTPIGWVETKSRWRGLRFTALGKTANCFEQAVFFFFLLLCIYDPHPYRLPLSFSFAPRAAVLPKPSLMHSCLNVLMGPSFGQIWKLLLKMKSRKSKHLYWLHGFIKKCSYFLTIHKVHLQ